MLQRFLDPATLASIASLKRLVNHFQDPRGALVTSAPSARQPDEGSKAGTSHESLKTPRLRASAVSFVPLRPRRRRPQRLAHLLCQCGRGEGLLNERRAGVQYPTSTHLIVCVARHVEHFHQRTI